MLILFKTFPSRIYRRPQIKPNKQFHPSISPNPNKQYVFRNMHNSSADQQVAKLSIPAANAIPKYIPVFLGIYN